MCRSFRNPYPLLLCLILLSKIPIAPEASPPRGQWPTKIDLGKWTFSSLDALIREGRKPDSTAVRVVTISAALLGTPYQAGTLIGGPETAESLVVNLEGVDCFTYLDYVLAASVSQNLQRFVEILPAIRYQNGEVAYPNRHHFFSQWLEANSQYVQNITASFRGDRCPSKDLNRKSATELWLKGIPTIKRKICRIPRNRLKAGFYTKLRSGDVIGFCTNKPGLDVTHLGLVVWREDKIMLRHASSARGRVVEEDLPAYVGSHKNISGLIVGRPRARRPADP